MKKLILLTFIVLCLSQSTFATSDLTFFDDLSCASKRLAVRPLTPEDFEAAKKVDESDDSFLNIVYGEEEGELSTLPNLTKAASLLKQKRPLKLLDSLRELPSGTLYLGAFEAEGSTLAGVIKISGLNISTEDNDKIALSTDVKFGKDVQGKGYATEAYNTLFAHLKHLQLIPADKNSINAAAFTGVHALIHLTNKPSLNCFLLKCSAEIERLWGDRVEILYPYASSTYPQADGAPIINESVDSELRPDFIKYLSYDADQSAPAEEKIYEASLKNLLATKPDKLEEALEDESAFVIRALGKFTRLFDELPKSMHTYLDKLLTEMEENIPQTTDVPVTLQKKIEEMLGYIKAIRQYFPPLTKETTTSEVIDPNLEETTRAPEDENFKTEAPIQEHVQDDAADPQSPSTQH